MADILQSRIEIEQICKAVEQKFDNVAITGVAPTLSTEPAGEQDFVPFYSDVDGILRYKNPGPTTPAGSIDEADAGGLFTFDHTQPGVLEAVLADLSSSVLWSVSIVTTAGDMQLASGTSRYINVEPKRDIMPGETVKIVAAVPTGKPWVRVYVRSDQARH